jgi:hypothetical protein
MTATVFRIAHCCGFVWIFAAAICGHSQPTDTASREFPEQTQIFLEQLINQYNSLSSLHLRARLQMSLDRDADGSGHGKEQTDGVFEFWFSDGKYRIVSQLSKEAPADEVAFDGVRFQLFEGSTRRLTVSTNNTDSFGISFPNPILAPFEFLKPADGSSVVHQPMMEDLRSGSSVHSRLRTYRIISHDPLVVEFPGGTMEGQKFVYRVHVSSNQVLVPRQIVAVGTDGSVIARSSISYKALPSSNPVGHWPSRVVREGFSEHGATVLRIETDIEPIDLNPKVTLATFQIDQKKADIIWDSDKSISTRTNQPEHVNIRIVRIVVLILFSGSIATLIWLSAVRKRMLNEGC